MMRGRPASSCELSSPLSSACPYSASTSAARPPKRSAKKIRSAVTDSDSVVAFDRENKPGVSNLLTIQAALTGRTIDDLVASYDGKQYGHLKVDTADVLTDFVTPLRGRVDELLADPAHLDAILAAGAAKARAVAAPTLREVYDKIGFLASSAT